MPQFVVVVVVVVVVKVKLVIDNSDPLMLIAAHVSCSAPLCCSLAPPIGLHVGFVFVSSSANCHVVLSRGGDRATGRCLSARHVTNFMPATLEK